MPLGLAERTAELAAEVRPREPGRGRHLLDPDRLRVTAVDEIPGAQQVPGRRHRSHTARLLRQMHPPEFLTDEIRTPTSAAATRGPPLRTRSIRAGSGLT